MREWNLKAGDPLSLTLAADARLGHTDYCNDQVWEVSIGGGEPPALAVQTTYGLRARSLRLFPRFIEDELTISDPFSFTGPPSIRHFYPNFLLLTFSPFPEIEVTAEYWVPTSQVIAGRLSISNHSHRPRRIRVEWVGLLTPATDGQRMVPVEMDSIPVLAGSSADLAPVFFTTGGPQVGSGPYPSLVIEVNPPANTGQQVTWAQAALSDPQASFILARQTCNCRWEAQRAHLELLNSRQIEIVTGDSDWDAAFALTQKVAFNLFLSSTDHLPYPSFVVTRQPDQGYSLRGDGGDYNHLWNGQTPLHSYYLSSIILPTAPQLVQGLLRNFLTTSTEEGFVDWKPGLGGQRSQLLATPLLVNLTWRTYQTTGDLTFLEESFPHLLAYLHAWFNPEHDRDGDNIPEWSHTLQTGFEDHPLFAYWHAWSQGVNITTAESPSLCAFLYRECQDLIKIASLLGEIQHIQQLKEMADNLRTAVEISWDTTTSSYHYWDRDSHFNPPHEMLSERQGSGELVIRRNFDQPVRIHLRVQSRKEATRQLQIFIHGSSPGGQHLVETINTERFQWYIGLGSGTSERIYTALERIEIVGLQEDDLVSVQSVGFDCQDITLLLPIWAGIPAAERAQDLVENTITATARFWRPFGMPACVDPSPNSDETSFQAVSLPWNVLIGEGLLNYGYRSEAAQLITRLMSAIIQNLKRDSTFRRHYHAETGQGMDERNALDGLAPLGLFLDILGVRLISPKQVVLSGFNPFPWPVTVKYQGLTILRQMDKTTVVFNNGETITIDSPNPQIVTLE